MGRVRVSTKTRGTHSSAREMGPASQSEEDGANATMSVAGHSTGKTGLQACSSQVLAMTRRWHPEGNRVTRHVLRHHLLRTNPGDRG